jgi:hypothetical protein
MLPVSVDCLFLIVPSVFSNVYLLKQLALNQLRANGTQQKAPQLQLNNLILFFCNNVYKHSCVNHVISLTNMTFFIIPYLILKC